MNTIFVNGREHLRTNDVRATKIAIPNAVVTVVRHFTCKLLKRNCSNFRQNASRNIRENLPKFHKKEIFE
jgi:hypothetical protein